MSYVDNNLIAGESVLYRTRRHWIVLVVPFVLAFLLLPGALSLTFATRGGFGLVMLAIVVGLAAIGILRRTSAEMAVTNKRVIVKQGVLRQSSLEIPFSKIESIAVTQGVLGRMAGYGDIVIRGTGGTPEPFTKIASPLEFRHQVQSQMDKEQTLVTSR